MRIAELRSDQPDFAARLRQLLAREQPQDRRLESAVADIIAQVRRDRDTALTRLTEKFDARPVAAADELIVPTAQITAALSNLPPAIDAALRAAAARIEDYHRRELHELQSSWQFAHADGSRLGQRVTPLRRVGIYVPGGRAAYPSSALMTAIPAAVAGVEEIIMAVPAPGGQINPAVLAAAAIAGARRIFTIGGAQAVAALAYGTETVPAVDKIVGPGNRYVAEAKRQVFGKVGIDTIAGPSEVVIICDRHANSDWAAMDLLAQAEHDECAQAIAISDSAEMLAAIRQSLERYLPKLPRRAIIARSLSRYGALIHAADLSAAARIANHIAPEHLELMTVNAPKLADEIRHAGAIFIGAHSAEALGDYCAGPNHVLPTAGAARFASPLGVADFQKRSHIVHMQAAGAAQLAEIAATLARCEGLEAHARAAEYRAADNAPAG